MGAGLFQHLAVRHDGAGQVGQVPLAEEGEGQFAQPLGQGQPPDAAFLVGGKIGAVVFKPGGGKNQRKAQDAPARVERGPAARRARHQIPHKEVKKAGGQHERHVLNRARQHAPNQAPRTLRGACGGLLDFLDHGYPSFATFHSTDDW